jgi:pyridoxal phosphate enzyme (YggS family)
MRFLDLPERVAEVRGRIELAAARGGHGQAVRIVAVTKTFGTEAVTAAWGAGLPDVGENRIQEAIAKKREVDVPVRWHLIGHLQRNKVKHITEFDLIQSLDSLRLAEAMDSVARNAGRTSDVLVQVNIAGEETKGGFEPSELPEVSERLAAMSGLRIRGVMAMAPLDADEARLRYVFAGARDLRGVLAAAGHAATELSMGMSNDYEIAVEEGATCVRLGTLLFGARST